MGAEGTAVVPVGARQQFLGQTTSAKPLSTLLLEQMGAHALVQS